jgi:hypothetical protein
MLTILTEAGAIPLHIDDYYIRQLYSGYDELIFGIDIYDPEYQLIQEESVIREESDDPALYLVKAIDGGGTTAQIKCQIDLDAWKTTLSVGYDSGSHTVGDIARAVSPTGWTVADASGKAFSRTIALAGATPLDVLEACRNAFDVTFRFDNVRKIVRIIDPESYLPLGAFMTRDLNLTEINYKGKSTDFATRLYAVGKDGMTFADINDGKAYVENHDYSERVVCAYWQDERYTVKENLLADAQNKIDELAKPQRSYDCAIVDLAATDPDKYGFQDFSLFAVVTLIDTNRNAGKVNHQVVEVRKYPHLPAKNSVTLSTIPPRIQSQVRQIIYDMTNPNSDYQSALMAAQLQATADILGAKGGAVRLLDTDGDDFPDTLYIADDPDPSQATYVWRFNYAGWGASVNGFGGPFILAATINSGIVAEFITAGYLSADRIEANSLGVSKLTGTIKGGISNSWILDLENGTLTIGNISANNITAGTMLADRIKGGTLTLGGEDNIDGTIRINGSWVLNDSLIGEWYLFLSATGLYSYDIGTDSRVFQLGVGYFVDVDPHIPYADVSFWNRLVINSASENEILITYDTVGTPHYSGAYSRFWNRADFVYFSGTEGVYIMGPLTVAGTKSRIAETEDYGDRLLYAYEMPAPMFGDCGEGEIGEDGAAYVWLDPIFAETISTDQYQVFLQKYGEGDLYVAERNAACFIVRGTAGLAFGWELKAKQADFDQRRLDTKIEGRSGPLTDYAADAADYLQTLNEGRTSI